MLPRTVNRHRGPPLQKRRRAGVSSQGEDAVASPDLRAQGGLAGSQGGRGPQEAHAQGF